jgi:hypothetical protein
VNLSPTIQLVLVVILAVASLLGPSGFAVWYRIRGQKGLDSSQKKEIDTRVANMTEDRLAGQKRDFDRQVNEIRSDQEEDRNLARDRYDRLVALERFADRVVVYYRQVDQAFGKLIALIPGNGDTLAEKGIVMPEPPTLPTSSH